MAYDTTLADRIRDLVVADLDITEKQMFGGLAFLVAGHMSVTVSGRSGLMVRVDREDAPALLLQAGVEQVVMQKRVMPGWLRVDGEQLADDEALRDWVDRSVDFARSLP